LARFVYKKNLPRHISREYNFLPIAKRIKIVLLLHPPRRIPSHVHLIAFSNDGSLSNILRDLKSFTANKLLENIKKNIQEIRRGGEENGC
jgi:hypothetical protein